MRAVFKLLALIAFNVMLILLEVNSQEYEKYSKFGTDHTMCIYKEKACPSYTLRRSGNLSCKEKQKILDCHNKFRQSIANGTVKGHPGAQNMAEMVWNNELSIIAQRWADQCTFGHDGKRLCDSFWAVGQNVVMFITSLKNNLNSNFTGSCKVWFDEVIRPGFKPENISPFIFDSSVGHYTQLGWAETFSVGCGIAIYNDTKRTYKLHVCNYGPAGNVIEDAMYIKGTPNCKAFPNLKQSERYPALCEVIGSNPPNLGPECDLRSMVEYSEQLQEDEIEIVPSNDQQQIQYANNNNDKVALKIGNMTIFVENIILIT